MNQNLAKLMELQQIDKQIYDLEVSSEQFPTRVQELEGLISQKEQITNDTETRLAALKNEKNELIEKRDVAQAGLDKSQERLNNITTNREYDAVHAEIETQKQITENAKHRLGALDDDIAKLESELESATEALSSEKEAHEPEIAELKGKIANIDSQIQELSKKRKELIPEIDKIFLRNYEKVQKRRKNGKIISLVSSTDKTCSICYMVLEPQRIQEIKNGKHVVSCPSCGSILAWADEYADIIPEG